MKLEELNKNFRYKYDKDQYGYEEVWDIMKPNKDGLYLGDCEDYALTIKNKVDGFSDWHIYTCKHNGVGHACLVSPQYSFVIDNLTKKVTDITEYITIHNITKLTKINDKQVDWWLKYGKFKKKNNSRWLVNTIEWFRSKVGIF